MSSIILSNMKENLKRISSNIEAYKKKINQSKDQEKINFIYTNLGKLEIQRDQMLQCIDTLENTLNPEKFIIVEFTNHELSAALFKIENEKHRAIFLPGKAMVVAYEGINGNSPGLFVGIKAD